jgi:hypothetical protein
VSHELAHAFKQAIRIRQFGSVEEADVDVGPEGIDVGKRSATHARGGLTIMQHLPNVSAAMANGFKPLSCHGTKRTLMFIPPKLHGGMALCRTIESK